MNNILFKQISEDKKIGTLFKVCYSNNDAPIQFTLKNTKTLFGIEYRYNTKYIKWVLDYIGKGIIQDLENNLRVSFEQKDNLQIKSKIINKPNYPTLLETKIGNNIRCSNDIIKHEPGVITSFQDICKKYNYNVIAEIKHISIKEVEKNTFMYYNIEIKQIEECVNS